MAVAVKSKVGRASQTRSPEATVQTFEGYMQAMNLLLDSPDLRCYKSHKKIKMWQGGQALR